MGFVRILAGRLKGRRLRVVEGVRPSGGRLREALFSRWQDRLAGAVFLDLFAGSGAVGLEAWSRGAGRCVFIEDSRRVVLQLREHLGLADSDDLDLIRGRLPRVLGRPFPARGQVDLAFADPPYAFRDFSGLLEAADPWLKQGAELVVEHAADVLLPDRGRSLELAQRRVYGDSALAIFRKREAPLAPGAPQG